MEFSVSNATALGDDKLASSAGGNAGISFGQRDGINPVVVVVALATVAALWLALRH